MRKSLGPIAITVAVVLLGIVIAPISCSTTPKLASQLAQEVPPQPNPAVVREPGASERNNSEAWKAGSENKIPKSFALAPDSSVRGERDWNSLISLLPPEERAIAEQFAARYPEAYQFNSTEQLEWLMKRGYPMPTEIVAAKKISLDDLIRRAQEGNPKAGMLAMDRLLEELEQSPRDANSSEYIRRNLQLRELEHQSRASCSPFAYYLSSRASTITLPSGASQAALVYLSIARNLGDWRLDRTLQEMSQVLGHSQDTLSLLRFMGSAYADVLPRNCGSGSPLPR